jgi:hypothetical protein
VGLAEPFTRSIVGTNHNHAWHITSLKGDVCCQYAGPEIRKQLRDDAVSGQLWGDEQLALAALARAIDSDGCGQRTVQCVMCLGEHDEEVNQGFPGVFATRM